MAMRDIKGSQVSEGWAGKVEIREREKHDWKTKHKNSLPFMLFHAQK